MSEKRVTVSVVQITQDTRDAGTMTGAESTRRPGAASRNRLRKPICPACVRRPISACQGLTTVKLAQPYWLRNSSG